MVHKFPILTTPGVGTAIEGVFVAFHAGLVTVVQAGAAGEGVLEERSHQQAVVGNVKLVAAQAAAGFFFPRAVEIIHKGGQDTGRIVSTQQIHVAQPHFSGIVLHDGHDRFLQTVTAVPATHEVQNRSAERIIHHAVQFRIGKVLSSAAVGGLVGSILPHFAQHIGIGVDFLHPIVEQFQKFVGQFVRHVQTEAVRTGLQPVGNDAVFIGDDILDEFGIHLVHRGQGVEIPPGIVVVRPMVEGVPADIRGFGGLESALAGEMVVFVEIKTVTAGVGVHTV